MVVDEQKAASSAYAQRLAEAMKSAGKSEQHLAGCLGVSIQAVRKVLRGGSQSLSAENNAKAAAYLEVQSDWLAIGDGPRARAQPTLECAESRATYRVDPGRLVAPTEWVLLQEILAAMELPRLAAQVEQIRLEVREAAAASTRMRERLDMAARSTP